METSGRQCQHCQGAVHELARRCRHCGRSLAHGVAQVPTPAPASRRWLVVAGVALAVIMLALGILLERGHKDSPPAAQAVRPPDLSPNLIPHADAVTTIAGALCAKLFTCGQLSRQEMADCQIAAQGFSAPGDAPCKRELDPEPCLSEINASSCGALSEGALTDWLAAAEQWSACKRALQCL